MQFTVLIEFLIPGLLTTFTLLMLRYGFPLPPLLAGLPGGETAAVLMLLAVSYPVGILFNFPIYNIFQKYLLSSISERKIICSFRKQGLDLAEIAGRTFGLKFTYETPEDLRRLWASMSAAAYTVDVGRLASSHLYHEGLQRFARGMLVPCLLGSILIYRHGSAGEIWLGLSLVALALYSSYKLLKHSLHEENDQIVRFFLVAIRTGKFNEARNNPADFPVPSVVVRTGTGRTRAKKSPSEVAVPSGSKPPSPAKS